MNVISNRLDPKTIHVANREIVASGTYPDALCTALSPDGAAQALAEISNWPDYQETPLLQLAGLARSLDLDSIYYKDEGGRFGLGSFKALGGAYAVSRLLQQHVAAQTGSDVTTTDLLAGKYRALTQQITVACATDGNHGRSVAWGAKLFGCRCVIYVHETVSEGRVDAVKRFGAQVVRHPGNYDATVHQASEDAARNSWVVVSDTSWEGYTDIPRDVMHGYCVMAAEALSQVPEGLTHIVVPGGVGGVAAAVCAQSWWLHGPVRPRVIVVEPSNAACLMESAHARTRSSLQGDIETVMAGLSCGEPSLLAWRVLSAGANDFVVVDDEMAVAAMRQLARSESADPPVVAGESAAAVIAVLQRAQTDPDLRRQLGLNAGSSVLVFGTEGDSDPDVYKQLVGMSADEVRAA